LAADNTHFIHSDITQRIIACARTVYHRLGGGFFERLYENAMAIEMKRAGLSFKQQCQISVDYDGITIGEYVADFLVEEAVIVELKAVTELADAHEAQVINYLRATGLEVGLLLNFGDKLDIKRKAYQTAKNKETGSER
jgi:GxxExxY protein